MSVNQPLMDSCIEPCFACAHLAHCTRLCLDCATLTIGVPPWDAWATVACEDQGKRGMPHGEH